MINLLIILHIYFVSFLDRPEKTAPQLSERAWEQRERWKIPTDQMDYPVSPMYQNELRKMGVKIHHVSRWFNGATCEMDQDLAAKVEDLDFVTGVEMTRMDEQEEPVSLIKKRSVGTEIIRNTDELIDMTLEQLRLYNLQPLHEAGFEGQGILMAVCDGGFHNANTLDCFRQDELEVGHFDFTDDKDDFYGSTGRHGTQCLSTISGYIENGTLYTGAAMKAQYVLMRSEENDTESPKEMDNFVAALEKADSLGVNVFSVSLGYYEFDYSAWDLPKSKLNGKSTRASLAATIAARKGMLVCVAAGNEGDNRWRTICVPGDADSVLTVGAVDFDGNIAGFSSRGPSADGRIKPEVCAVGVDANVISPLGSIVQNSGTSFATPLIAGLAASLWSALPEENAMQIRDRIIRSADRYSDPDPQKYGYGIPNAWKAYTNGEGATVNNDWIEPEPPQKIIRGDQILIIRHGHIYNLAGQKIE